MENRQREIVSVIVPVYNACGTLRACIDSILEQTYAALEVVAVDDGSTDSSLEILRDYAKRDSRMIVLTQPNGGVGAARNAAIKGATGRYLQFVDSDDALPPDATERMVDALESQDCDMVIGAYISVTGKSEQRRGFLKRDGVLTQAEFLEALSKFPNSFYYDVLWNKLYRREYVVEYGVHCDEGLPWGEDFAFNAQYFIHALHIAVLTHPIYRYTRRIQGLTFGSARYALRHPILSIRVKWTLYKYYIELFKRVGLYHQFRRVLPRYKYRITINN